MTAQTGLKAVPAHGKVFYIDSGVTPKVDAAYIGYRIENSSGSTKTGLWVSVESFIGGKLSLANPLDQYQQMDPITTGNYKSAFYLLKSLGSSTLAQTHTVKVFDRRPDLNGATAVLTCDFTFSQIQETIKANSNKVNSVTGALSPSTATLGGTLTVSVTGSTGKVGAGKTPDFSIIWVSPAAVSTWPTRSLRLESTSITLDCSGSLPNITLTDTLLQSTADTSCFTSTGTWTGSYVFRIIGPGPASLTPSPIANISSGTQYKHSDISTLTFASGINLSGVATSTFTVTVTASSTVISSTSSSVRIQYTITLSTTSTTAVEVDEVIDRPAAGTTLVTGTSTLNGSATSEPSYLASESSLSPPPVHYIGPYSVISGTNVVITFQRDIPCSNVSTPYSNTAYAKTGDQILGSTTTTIPGVTVNTLTSGASSCGVTVTDNPQTIAPTVQTNAATSITSSTATLNGYANAYGASGVTTYFKYSTDRNIVLSVTTTSAVSLTGSANEARSASISGLSPGTTYYFQAVVTSSSATSYGATLSFTTDFVQAVPTVVTTAATSVATTAATLNGYVNPNLTSVTKVQFIFGTTSDSVTNDTSTEDCTSSNNSYPCVVQIDDGNGQLTNLTLTGSGQTAVSFDTSSLTSGTVYYFKLQVLCTTDTTYCPGGKVSGSVLQFKTGAPQITTTEATSVAETTATLNGTMSSTGTTVKYQFYYCASAAGCTASTLSGGSTVGTSSVVSNPFNSTITFNLTGLTGNTTYFYQAQGIVGSDVVSYGEILSFTTILITTSSLPNGTLGSSYSTGLSGSGGIGPYTWSSTSLPAGLSLSSSGVITGTPTSGGTTSITFTLRDEYYGTTTTKSLNLVVKASVTYALGGGSGTLPTEVDHASGETFSLAASTGITKTGYTFAGWNDGISTYSASATYTMGSTNVTLTAQWTINSYTLTYNGNENTSGSAPAPVTQDHNTTVTVSANTGSLVKLVDSVNYTFAGWNTAANGSGTNYAAGSTFTFTANTTLYARWTAPGAKTVTFNSNYGATPTTSSQSASSTTALTSNSFTRTGYTFAGWGTDSSTATVDYLNGANYSFSADITLYAKWTINTYTLTYVANTNGGITYGDSTGTPKTQSVTYLGNGAAVTATPNTGYSFTSWNDGNTNATRTDTSITANATYTASFSINSYLITFNANGGSGGSSVSLNYNVDAIPSKPSDPTRSGYTFGGWSTDGTTALASYTVTSAATLLAVWTINSYTVSYNGNGYLTGTVPSSVTQNYNTTVTVSSNTGSLAKGTDTLSSWNTAADGSGTSYATSGSATFTLGASNVTLYAQWTAAGSYTVTFNSNYGTATTTTQTASTTTALTANSFVRTGYTFAGWGTDSSTATVDYANGANYSFSADVTLYAKWTINSYTVSYNGNGYLTGTVPSSVTQNYNTTVTVSSNTGSLAKGTDTLSSWNTAADGSGTSYATSGSATFTLGASNVTLYAQWTATTAQPVQVYIPNPPTITKISSPEVCAVGSQLVITGTYLLNATVKVDSVAAQVLSSTNASMLIALPARPVGTKTIVVTNPDGSASTTVKYKFIDSPIYVNYIYPETFKDSEFSYTFTATNAEKYSIIGILPLGLTLNPLTGELSGTPTVVGNHVFTIVASNFCDETYLNVYMYVDRAIPSTFTCSVAFNIPKSNNISDVKLSLLKTCLEKIKVLTPKYIQPIIYLSGGVPAGLSPQEALVHPRYLKIIDFIKSIGLDYQIYVGAFSGATDSVQLNVYWPTT